MQNIKMKNGNQLLSKVEQRKAEPKIPGTEPLRRLIRIDPRKSEFRIPGKQQSSSDGEQKRSEPFLTNGRTSLPYRHSGSDIVKRSSSTKIKHNVINSQFDAIFTATSQKSTTKEICYFRSKYWKDSGQQSRVWMKKYEEDDDHGSCYDRRNDYVEDQEETSRHFYGYQNYNRSVSPYNKNNSHQYRPIEKSIYTDYSWKCSSSTNRDSYRPYYNDLRSRIPSRITSRITTCGERSERRTTCNLYAIGNTNKRTPLLSLNNSERTSKKLNKETFVTKNGKYSSITKDSCATTKVVEEISNEKDSVKASRESSLDPLSSVVNLENSVVSSEKKNEDVVTTDTSKNLIEFNEKQDEIISQPICKDYDNTEVSMEIDSDSETVYFGEAAPYESELTLASTNTNSTFLNCNLKSIAVAVSPVQSSNTNESEETTKSSKVESSSTNEERDTNQSNSKQSDVNATEQKSDSELTIDSINTNATFLNDYFESFVTTIRSIQSSNINSKKTKETEETTKSSEIENTNAKNDRSGCVMESPSTNKEQNSSKQSDFSITEQKSDSGSNILKSSEKTKIEPEELKPESNSSDDAQVTQNNDKSLQNENINISPAEIINTVIPTKEESDEKDTVKSQVQRKRSRLVSPLEISENGQPKRARSRNRCLEITSLPDKLPSKKHSRSKSKSSFTCCSVPSKEVNKLIIRRKRQIISDPHLEKESDLPICSYKSSSPEQKKHLSSKPKIIPTSPNTDALDSRFTTQIPSRPKDLSNEGKKSNVVSLTEYANSYKRTPATERAHTISPTTTSHMSFLFGSDDSDDNNRAELAPKLDTNSSTKNRSSTKEHNIPTTSNHQLLAILSSKVSPRLSLELNQKEDSENSSKDLPKQSSLSQRTIVKNASRRNSIESDNKTKPVKKRTDSNKTGNKQIAEKIAEIPLVETTNKEIIETQEQRGSSLSTSNIFISINKSEKMVEIESSENVALEPLQEKMVKTVEEMIQRRPSNIKFSELLAARLSADNEEMLGEPDKNIPEVVEQKIASLFQSPNGEPLSTEETQSDKKLVKTIKKGKPLLPQATNGEQLSTERPVGKAKSSNSSDAKVCKSTRKKRPAIHVLSNVVVNHAKIPVQRRSSLLQATSSIKSNNEPKVQHASISQLSDQCFLNSLSNLETDLPESKTGRRCKQARKIKPCDVTIMPAITWEVPVVVQQPSTGANENSINQPVGVINLCDSDNENEIRNVDFVNNLMREVIENKPIIQSSDAITISAVTIKEEPVETLMDISDGLNLKPIQVPVRITPGESSDTAADVDTPIPVDNIEQPNFNPCTLPNLTMSPVVRQNLNRVAVSNVEQAHQRAFYENISPPAPYFRQTNYNNQVGPNNYQGVLGITNNQRFVGSAVKTVTHTQFANTFTMKILLYIDACELKNQLMDVYRNYEMTEEILTQEFQFYDLGLREKLKQFAEHLLNYLNVYQVKNFNFKTFLLLVHKCADKNLQRSVPTRQVVWVLVQALRLYKDLCMANTGFLNEVYFQTIILWQQDVEHLERTRLTQAGTLMNETQKAVFYQQCEQYYLFYLSLWGNQARQSQRIRASVSATSSSLQQPLQSSVQLRPSCSMQSQPQPHLQLPVVTSERITAAPQAEPNTQNISLQSMRQEKPQKSAHGVAPFSHYTKDDFKIRLLLSNPYEPPRMTHVIATAPVQETVPTSAPAVQHISSSSRTVSDCVDDTSRQTFAAGTSNSISIKQEAEEVDENVIDVDKWYAETNVVRQNFAADTSNSTNSVSIKQEAEEVDENVIDVDKWYAETNVDRQNFAADTSNSTNSVRIKQEAKEVDEDVIDVDNWHAQTNVVRQSFAAGTSNSTNSVNVKQEDEEMDEDVIDVDKWYSEKMMTEDVVCLNLDYFDLSHFIKTDFDVKIKIDTEETPNSENNQGVGTGHESGTEQAELKPQKKRQQHQQPQQHQPQQQQLQQKQQQQQQLMTNRSYVRIASADSGFSSPLRQIEHPEILSGGRSCICFKKAELVCECRLAIYCSQECQVKEWPNHREQCFRAREDHCKKMGIL